MKIYPMHNKYQINFKGVYGFFPNKSPSVQTKGCTIETHHGRDLESLYAARESLIKDFPAGGTILNYGCSTGQETYDIAAMLADVNKDKRYKIEGYDICPEVIEDAKLGVHKIESSGNIFEQRLFNSAPWYLTKEQELLKEGLNQYFQLVPGEWHQINTSHPQFHRKIRKALGSDPDFETTKKKIIITNKKVYNKNLNEIKRYGKAFMPKENLTEEIVSFEVGDIMEIGSKHKDTKPIMLTFKNALYHLMGSKNYEVNKNYNLDLAEKLFKELKYIIPKNGLFFIGSSESDHLFLKKSSDNIYEEVIQNGEKIKTCTSTPVHKLLKAAGFEPIFFDYYKFADLALPAAEVFLPSLWKKLR